MRSLLAARMPASQPHLGTDAFAPAARTNADEAFIRFDGFGKSFGALVATRGVNLQVRRGEFLTIVGPSGCGKSTLLNATAGVFAPTEGRVFYGGRPVEGFNLSVGYMTQNDHLLPWRSVAANIAVPLEIRRRSKGEIADRVAELMEAVGLSGFGDAYPSQLSGGMRKRCALARVLAYDPETLLMDEPFGALDAQLRLAMQVRLRTLCMQLGKTVVFVTHDLDEAIAVADRCCVFSPRPGTVREVIDIDLPRERDLYALRSDRRYQELTAHVWSRLAPHFRAEEEAE